MFDELMLPDTATVLRGKDGAKLISLRVRLPWYRSLPISCVEQINLVIDGSPIDRSDLSISVGDVRHSLEEATLLHHVSWFVLDQATLEFSFLGKITLGPHEVSISISLRIPYTEPEYFPLDFTQVATHKRLITFNGVDCL